MAKKGKNKKFIIYSLIIVIIGLLFSWFYYFKNNKVNNTTKSTQKPVDQKLLDEYKKRKLSEVQVFTQKFNSFEYSNWSYISSLEKKITLWNFSYEDIAKAIYVNDMEWNYKKSDEFVKILCKKFSDKCTPANLSKITITWYVKDHNDLPLKWAKVSLVDNNIFTLTDSKWQYKFSFNSLSWRRISVRTSLIWYADDFFRYTTSFETNKNIWNDVVVTKDFRLNKANDNDVYKTTTDEIKKSPINSWVYIYDFKDVIFYDINWKEFSWPINVYTYFFDRENWSNLINLDVFDNTRNYLWNWMVTFGMPYVIVYDDKWNELDIKRSNPIKCKWKTLYLDEIPKISWDRLDEKWFIWTWKKFTSTSFNLWFSQEFPLYWWLDRKTWVWYEEWKYLLNRNWDYTFDFYTVR